eukprot:scaffold27860_cov27-Cyclotella_meneghiniana.AAC.5
MADLSRLRVAWCKLDWTGGGRNRQQQSRDHHIPHRKLSKLIYACPSLDTTAAQAAALGDEDEDT